MFEVVEVVEVVVGTLVSERRTINQKKYKKTQKHKNKIKKTQKTQKQKQNQKKHKNKTKFFIYFGDN